jgi:phosphoinositide-3-kinase regulatory subunit 4
MLSPNTLIIMEFYSISVVDAGDRVASSDWLVPGAQSVLVYATMYGSIVGWDLRAPGTAWKLENDLKRGEYTIAEVG